MVTARIRGDALGSQFGPRGAGPSYVGWCGPEYADWARPINAINMTLVPLRAHGWDGPGPLVRLRIADDEDDIRRPIRVPWGTRFARRGSGKWAKPSNTAKLRRHRLLCSRSAEAREGGRGGRVAPRQWRTRGLSLLRRRRLLQPRRWWKSRRLMTGARTSTTPPLQPWRRPPTRPRPLSPLLPKVGSRMIFWTNFRSRFLRESLCSSNGSMGSAHSLAFRCCRRRIAIESLGERSYFSSKLMLLFGCFLQLMRAKSGRGELCVSFLFTATNIWFSCFRLTTTLVVFLLIFISSIDVNLTHLLRW